MQISFSMQLLLHTSGSFTFRSYPIWMPPGDAEQSGPGQPVLKAPVIPLIVGSQLRCLQANQHEPDRTRTEADPRSQEDVNLPTKHHISISPHTTSVASTGITQQHWMSPPLQPSGGDKEETWSSSRRSTIAPPPLRNMV